MSLYKNEEHFNVGGDKTVTVTVTFDVGEKADDKVIMRDAAWYLKYFADTGVHNSWARSIEVKE